MAGTHAAEQGGRMRVGRRSGPDAGAASAPGADPGAPERDPVEFDGWYEQQHRPLFGALYLMTGSRQEAEELMQEAFLQVWKQWSRVAEMENPTGYLFRTAMNGARMRRRRAVVAARRLVRGIARSDDLEAAETRHEVDAALATLAPRQRAAVILLELLDFDSQEAGSILGVSAASVRKLGSDGRRALRRALGEPDA